MTEFKNLLDGEETTHETPSEDTPSEETKTEGTPAAE